LYWIVTSPKDQLLTGHETGIIGFDTVESEQQNIAQGDFVIVYSSLETTGGARLDAFTGLGRTTDAPGQMPEGPWAINRRIAFFSTFELPFASIQIELAYPKELPQWREKTVFNVDVSDFLAIAEAMLLPPVFKKVRSVAKGPLL